MRLSVATAKATLSAAVAPADLVKRCIAAGDVAVALAESTFAPPEKVALHINVMRGTQVRARPPAGLEGGLPTHPRVPAPAHPRVPAPCAGLAQRPRPRAPH